MTKFERLLESLNDCWDIKERRALVGRMVLLEDEGLDELFISLLQDEDWNVRNCAVMCLGNDKIQQAMEPLVDLLKRENDRTVINGIGLALRSIKNPATVDLLIPLFLTEDTDEYTCRTIANVFREFKDARATQPLLKRFGFIPKHAAYALGNLGDQQAVDPLIKLLEERLESHDTDVCDAIVTALGKLKSPKAVDVLTLILKGNNDFHVNSYSADARHNWRLCESVMRAMESIGDPRAIEPLKKVVKNGQDGDKDLLSVAKKVLITLLKNEIKQLGYLDENELAYLAYLEEARRVITQMVEVATPEQLGQFPGIRTWLESYPDDWVKQAKSVGEDALDKAFAYKAGFIDEWEW